MPSLYDYHFIWVHLVADLCIKAQLIFLFLTDHDTDSQSPDTVHVQNKLLDTISSCLRMLIALSPDLVALVTDDIVDKDAFEQLLQIGFSTPAFEQVQFKLFLIQNLEKSCKNITIGSYEF